MSQGHYQLAQLNIAELKYPLESPELADFVDNLERINALAESSPGFVWRLQTEEGDATAIDHFGDGMLVNMSVWRCPEDLHDFVYNSEHLAFLRRKQEWFGRVASGHMVLWWIPAGQLPTLEEAEEKLGQLREQGPTASAFTPKQTFPSPGDTDT